MEKLIYAFLFLFILSSCSGEKWNDCIEAHGDDVTETRHHGNFNQIKVDGNFEVRLIQDSSYTIEVTAGENFVGQILTKVEDGVLILEEEITCKFMRDQDRVYSVQVHCGTINRIEHFSGKGLRGENISSSRLEIDKWAGGGDLILDLKCDSVFGRIHAGSGDLSLSGRTGFGYFYQRGYGFIRNRNLEITHAFVDKGGTGDCTLSVDQNIDVEFNSYGNLHIYGNSVVNTLNKKGSGSIIVHQ